MDDIVMGEHIRLCEWLISCYKTVERLEDLQLLLEYVSSLETLLNRCRDNVEVQPLVLLMNYIHKQIERASSDSDLVNGVNSITVTCWKHLIYANILSHR